MVLVARQVAGNWVVVCRVLGAEDEVTPLRLARIDAARGIGERIEYEVPADPAGLFLTLVNNCSKVLQPIARCLLGASSPSSECQLALPL